jgi:hypothetical protein
MKLFRLLPVRSFRLFKAINRGAIRVLDRGLGF